MDLLIAANSVPLSQAAAAPTTGTPQYAWDGIPPLQPGTVIESYIFNQILAELVVGLIQGAGITPDRTDLTQVRQAVLAMIAVEAAAREAADAAEVTARVSGDTAEATTRATADTAEANTRASQDTATYNSGVAFTEGYAFAKTASFLSPSSPGYSEHPTPQGTEIRQWGYVTLPADSTIHTYSFPTSFPNACLSINISYGASAPPSNGACGAQTNGASTFQATNTATGGASGHGCYWEARGW